MPYPPTSIGGHRITRARTLPLLPTFDAGPSSSVASDGRMSIGLPGSHASGPTDNPFHLSPTDETQPSPLAARTAPAAAAVSRLSSLLTLPAGPSAPFQALHPFQTAHNSNVSHTPQTPLAPLTPLTPQALHVPQPTPQTSLDGLWNGWNPYVWQNSPMKQSYSAPCTSSSSPVPGCGTNAIRRASASVPQSTSGQRDMASSEADALLAAFMAAAGGGTHREEDRGTETSSSAENLELGTWPRQTRHLTG